jgi:predicted transcriptional regulator of viral defense system
MTPRVSKTERLISFIGERRLIRARDLASANIDRKILQRACARGLVECIGRGAYRLLGAKENPIAVACKRVPKGVICFHSALAFHGLIEVQPPEVWMAIGPRERIPQSNGSPMKFVRFSGDALTQGVQNINLDGIPVRVYSPMKSVADCLKFRNKIGVEIARSALRASVADGSFSRDRLLHFARICRVEKLLAAGAIP